MRAPSAPSPLTPDTCPPLTPDTSHLTPELLLEPGRAERQYWRDLWRYRELFYILAWRDISVRYKQTVIGVAWALIQPLLTMLIMTLVFGKVAGLPSDGNAPYALMVFAAMLPWQFFSTALSTASQSLVSNANLISKVYFPRMIVPASSVITSFVDFLDLLPDPGRHDGLVSLLARLADPHACRCSWPLAFLAAVGPGLWITAMNVKYRDFRYVVPFVVQFGLYVSPVGLQQHGDPPAVRRRGLYDLFAQPMVGVIDGFRWAILGGEATIYWPGFLLSVGLRVPAPVCRHLALPQDREDLRGHNIGVRF